MKSCVFPAVLLAALGTSCLSLTDPAIRFPSPYPGYDSLQGGQEPEQGREQEPGQKSDRAEEPDRSFLHVLLLYLPNRAFDMLDLVRLRLRVGPGLSLSARATKPLSVYLGAHTGVYAGLPGPRGDRSIPLPVGLEAQGGAQVSVADAAAGTYYGPTEIGAGAQLFIVGFDVGVDPLLELFDLVGGILTFDPAGDDL